MPTVTELRQHAKSLGLVGYSKLKKLELEILIAGSATSRASGKEVVIDVSFLGSRQHNFSTKLRTDDHVSMLRAMVMKHRGWRNKQFSLVYKARKMNDAEKFSKYNLISPATVHVIIKMDIDHTKAKVSKKDMKEFENEVQEDLKRRYNL